MFNKNIYGQWINETNLYNIFYNPNSKTSYYWVVEEDGTVGLDSKGDFIEFNLVKIAGSQYIDMLMAEHKGMKVHNILKIEFIDPNTMYLYDFKLEKDYLQRFNKEIKFENKGAADSEEFIITSNPRQLQRFIKKHGHLFNGNPLVFRKVKDTNNDTVKELLKSFAGKPPK
ncbi:MAG: hypothetical protein HQL01_07605 [Nitrospirae bacterium]|nr:hypothetical protein [Nitrospirota bacterium]